MSYVPTPPNAPPPYANPYGPPAAWPEQKPPSGDRAKGALYTANHVAIATFLSTTVGGSLLMAINEHRLGRTQAAMATIGVGLLATIAVFTIAIVLPDNIPSMPINIAVIVGARQIAIMRQQARVQAHTAAGGQIASNWAAVGLGVLTLLVVCVPILVVIVAVGGVD